MNVERFCRCSVCCGRAVKSLFEQAPAFVRLFAPRLLIQDPDIANWEYQTVRITHSLVPVVNSPDTLVGISDVEIKGWWCYFGQLTIFPQHHLLLFWSYTTAPSHEILTRSFLSYILFGMASNEYTGNCHRIHRFRICLWHRYWKHK